MGRRSTIETLPPELKAWLDAELLRRGFGDYVELAKALTAQGVEVSKSSLHRYGSRFEERMAQLRVSTEQARALVAASPDDEGAMNEALIRLTQDKLFGLLVDMNIDPAKVDISKITKSIADVAKASVLQKKWQVDMRERVMQAATEVEQTARKAGMSDETIDLIRQKILGVVDQPRKVAA